MINKINNFLESYIFSDNIPLKQIVSKEDIQQLAISLYHLTKSKEQKDFENISSNIFNALEEKGDKATYSPIEEIPFRFINSDDESIANIAELGYYCFMYFKVIHNLPLERVLGCVNLYMVNHIIDKKDINKVNCNNPISNFIKINDEQYIRFNGKTIIPPFDEIKDNFIKELKTLIT